MRRTVNGGAVALAAIILLATGVATSSENATLI